jgi:hypothetical protein
MLRMGMRGRHATPAGVNLHEQVRISATKDEQPRVKTNRGVGRAGGPLKPGFGLSGEVGLRKLGPEAISRVWSNSLYIRNQAVRALALICTAAEHLHIAIEEHKSAIIGINRKALIFAMGPHIAQLERYPGDSIRWHSCGIR